MSLRFDSLVFDPASIPLPERRKVTSYPELIEHYGSRRVVLEQYWRGNLGSAVEHMIEETVKPEILIGYKPLS